MKGIIIQGSSIRKEYVKCFYCQREYVWLKAHLSSKDGVYIAECAKCRDKKSYQYRQLVNTSTITNETKSI